MFSMLVTCPHVQYASDMSLCAVSGPQCQLPAPLRARNRWRSLDSSLSLHLDSGNTSFSFLKSGTLLEQVMGVDVACDNITHVSTFQVSCHSVSSTQEGATQMVAHVKSGW